MKAGDIALRSKLARLGMTVNAVDNAPFVASLHAYYQEWAKTFGRSVGDAGVRIGRAGVIRLAGSPILAVKVEPIGH